MTEPFLGLWRNSFQHNFNGFMHDLPEPGCMYAHPFLVYDKEAVMQQSSAAVCKR